MRKLTAITIGTTLATTVALLLAAQHRTEVARLKAEIELLKAQGQQPRDLPVETVYLSKPASQTSSPDDSPHEASTSRSILLWFHCFGGNPA